MPSLPGSFSHLTSALAKALAAAGCVVAASFVGLWMATGTQSVISPFWPASGVAVGAVLLWGWPALAGVYAGVLASNLFHGMPVQFVLVGPLGLVAETALATAIVRAAIGKRARLDDLRGILAIVLGAAWLPPFLNALICGRYLKLADGSPFLGNESDILRFVLANGFGIALITPAMLVWWRSPVSGWWWRFIMVFAATAAATWLAFGLGQPAFLLVIPVLAGAVATGLRGTSVMSAITALVIVVLSGMGFGPLVTPQGVDYSRV